MNVQELDNRVCWEVCQVLDHLGTTYIKRVPADLYKEIKTKSLMNKELTNTNISREAIVIIATLHSNYWTNSEEERKKLDDIFKENEEKYQNDLRKKYNPNIFENQQANKEPKQQQLIIKQKEKWYYKLWKKIKNIIQKYKIGD